MEDEYFDYIPEIPKLLTDQEFEEAEKDSIRKPYVAKLLKLFRHVKERPELKVKAMLNSSLDSIYTMTSDGGLSVVKDGDVNPLLKANLLIAEKSASIMKGINETKKLTGEPNQESEGVKESKFKPKLG
jgi:hypothetical protein